MHRVLVDAWREGCARPRSDALVLRWVYRREEEMLSSSEEQSVHPGLHFGAGAVQKEFLLKIHTLTAVKVLAQGHRAREGCRYWSSEDGILCDLEEETLP